MILTPLGTFVQVMITLSVMIFVLGRVWRVDQPRRRISSMPLRGLMGLDDPLALQYLRYMGHALTGDLGMSQMSERPVLTDLTQTVPATVEFVLASVISMFAVAIPVGVITAHSRHRWMDPLGRILSLTGVAIPGFLFSITLQLLAARFLHDWPVIGRIDHSPNWQSGPTGFLPIDGLLSGRPDVTASALPHQALPASALSMAAIG